MGLKLNPNPMNTPNPTNTCTRQLLQSMRRVINYDLDLEGLMTNNLARTTVWAPVTENRQITPLPDCHGNRTLEKGGGEVR